EDARRETEARFAAAFEACPLPYAMMQMSDRTLIAVNDAFAAFFGYTRDELVGQSDVHEFYADPVERDLARTLILREGRAHDLPLSLRRRDGTLRKVLASFETVMLGGVLYGMAVFADVTEKEQAERELRTTQELFSRVFSNSPLARSIVRADDLAYVEVNDAYVELLGYSYEELAGKRVTDFPFFVDPPEQVAVTAAQMANEPLRGMPLRLRRKSGGVIDVLFYSEPLAIDGVRLITATIHDVTARTRAEAALRESEERFAKAFDGNPLPSVISRVRDRRMIAVNDQWLARFGYSRDEIVGKSASDIALYANVDDGARVREQIAHGGAVHNLDLRFVRRDGREFDAILSVEIIEIGGEPHYLATLQDITDRKRAEAALRESEARFRQLAENIREVFWLYDTAERKVVYVSPAYEAVWQRSRESITASSGDWLQSVHPDDRARAAATRRREDYDQQYRIVRGDGSVRWIHDRAFPVRDRGGRVVRIAGLAEDITERRALEDQLRQTQKMESLGLLAGGVAHDFNNLLAVISSSNGMLAESLPSTGEPRELVEEIDAAVQRATSLTRQLLAFSRKQVVEPKVIDINDVVQDTRKMLRRMVGEDVLLQTSLEPELAHVKVDPGYLVQVLMNLAVNARDAMPRGGTLEIATRRVLVDEAQARRHLDVAPGPAVELSMTDTGCGMSAETLTHIFEPFFTTKEQGKGTGMGLAVVHGIVEQAGGFIEVDSTLGSGTTFRVYLPVVDAQVDRKDEVAGALAVGAERILFVDDDEYVRRAAARALRSRGYTVLEAADGRAALSQLHDDIDLLLTDVVMPRMDGRELAQLACQAHPGLKVLYTSGYTDDAIVRHGVADGNFDLIEKPFRVQALATRIRQVLDR
ncbi:MAG TPA: PAS domain S-box protein, partial [Kofleriaceae bacterium]|nr:PAS domain S-box protein [Kofleriaceae bacterium]